MSESGCASRVESFSEQLMLMESPMKKFLCRYALSIAAIYCSAAIGQSNDETEAQASANRLPYEVVVTPTVSRSDLRKLLVQVEEDFFEKFNELNVDERYDILCYRYIPTASHIPERVCEPYFMINSRAANVSEVVSMIMGPPGKPDRLSVPLFDPRAMRNQVAHEYDILQMKMEELNKSNLELRSIGKALATLKSRIANYGKD